MNWHDTDSDTTLAEAQDLVAAAAPTPRIRPKRGWPAGDHRISINTGRELIERRRRAAQVSGGAFKRADVERLLQQTGCVGMRIYYGMHADGQPCFVLVGVDQYGEELLDGELLEQNYPCPPFCPVGPSLGRAG